MHNILIGLLVSCAMLLGDGQVQAAGVAAVSSETVTQDDAVQAEDEGSVDVKGIVFGHIGDAYWSRLSLTSSTVTTDFSHSCHCV